MSRTSFTKLDFVPKQIETAETKFFKVAGPNAIWHPTYTEKTKYISQTSKKEINAAQMMRERIFLPHSACGQRN